ncbi:MAG: hypothetical protein GC134_04720 [Proteobacteria bacterium]|nr:hypothetical protein [Pseudomonadota bacterium]
MTTTITLAPMIPLLLLVPLAVMAALLAVAGGKSSLLRLIPVTVLFLMLAGPVKESKTLKPIPDTVVLVEDASRSNDVPARAEQRHKIMAALTDKLDKLTDVDVIKLTTTDTTGQGSNLFTQIQNKLNSLPHNSLSAIIAVTDGELTEVPDTLPAPLHVVPSGRKMYDRRLVVHNVPSYAIVDKPQSITLEIVDEKNTELPLTVSIVGYNSRTQVFPTNTKITLPFTITRAGTTALEMSIPVADDELTAQNNKAVTLINGVRENLNVLLVSGLPHNGSRVLRSLLKSDPSVNLVHFTILRTLTRSDSTPDRDLALIPFPVRELFVEQLKRFDLIIFDHYIQRGMMRDLYFENINDYVRDGGALMVLAGPAYGSPLGLSRTPLQDILPLDPMANNLTTPYRAKLTKLGLRHPVTEIFEKEQTEWGQFRHQVPALPTGGETLLEGIKGYPLLVLNHVGRGRVAAWMSDHFWFWARGIDGGGPEIEMLRRLTHWLMQEPELEEEALTGKVTDHSLTVNYRSLSDAPTQDVDITAPRGEKTTITLTKDENFKAVVPADEDGLYTLKSSSGHVAYAVKGSVKDLEWLPKDNTPALQALAESTGGSYRDDLGTDPDVVRLRAGMPAAGAGWIGLPRLDRSEVTGLTRQPLLPAWTWLLAGLASLLLTWWVEGRRR